MPRAQKHPAAVRHQLEKLRLDVALKRTRLGVARKALPKPPPPRNLNPEQIAVQAQIDSIRRESALLWSRHTLSQERIKLSRKRRELENSLKEEEYLNSHYRS